MTEMLAFIVFPKFHPITLQSTTTMTQQYNDGNNDNDDKDDILPQQQKQNASTYLPFIPKNDDKNNMSYNNNNSNGSILKVLHELLEKYLRCLFGRSVRTSFGGLVEESIQIGVEYFKYCI
jgi:hypothetical protein